MTDSEAFAVMIGFTPPWWKLGVVDDAGIARQRAEWNQSEDHYPEHYRYRTFREFLASQLELTADLATALFELGASDPDDAMGGAMMADIVRHPDCPANVLDAALASGRQHLLRIAQRRRAKPSNADDNS